MGVRSPTVTLRSCRRSRLPAALLAQANDLAAPRPPSLSTADSGFHSAIMCTRMRVRRRAIWDAAYSKRQVQQRPAAPKPKAVPLRRTFTICHRGRWRFTWRTAKAHAGATRREKESETGFRGCKLGRSTVCVWAFGSRVWWA